MQKEFTLTVAAAKISEFASKDIGTTALGIMLKELYPDHHISGKWIVTIDQIRFIAQYWAQWGYKSKDRISISEWADFHKMKIPAAYAPPVPVVIKKEKKSDTSKSQPIDERKLSKMVRDIAQDEIKKAADRLSSPAPLLIAASSGIESRDSDARIRAIEDQIVVFQRDHEISRKRCMILLEQFALDIHDGWTQKRPDAEEFPYFLRKHGYIDQFIRDMPSLFDRLHDFVNMPTKQGVLI